MKQVLAVLACTLTLVACQTPQDYCVEVMHTDPGTGDFNDCVAARQQARDRAVTTAGTVNQNFQEQWYRQQELQNSTWQTTHQPLSPIGGHQ